VDACKRIVPIACNDNDAACAGGVGARVCVAGLTPGATYYIQLGSVTEEDTGLIQLNLESPCPLESSIPAPVPPPRVRIAAESFPTDGTSGDPPAQAFREPSGYSARHREYPEDPPMPRPSAPPPGVVAGRAFVERDGYVSVQVNVDALGDNIPGDAANEPSIAVDPTSPNRIVIGWRQFDSIDSNFRQAGVAYSHDSGRTWTFPGVLTPGVFRSDPVLVADNEGLFHYLGVATHRSCSYHCDLFTSRDGGVTWADPVFALGGDKPWMTVDTTYGPGRNNLYQTWSRFGACQSGTTFGRSTDRGASWGAATDRTPQWGTLTVDRNGVLYVAGRGYERNAEVLRSTNAWNARVRPDFTTLAYVPLGSLGSFGNSGPNPWGLLGQVWIRSDRWVGSHAGNLYLLVGSGHDVKFSRSEDGGFTWSEPVRVNDDPEDEYAWQWFGMMDVAPNGRIDAVWNDTRNTSEANLSELYYASSTDGGRTWSTNVPVSPVFDSYVGWPNQKKIGDYYDMASDNAGLSIAYAATFNGEQDVYFLRIGMIDCNGNGQPDDEDIAKGLSSDCNDDGLPDECGADCDRNGEPDVCELLIGADDCDGNRWLDICQEDHDQDGLIDPCDPDQDDDGVPNESDLCPRSPNGMDTLADGRPRIDTTGDCFVDLRDYWRFRNCLVVGRLGAPPPWEACLERFDVDNDEALDLRDFAAFQNGYTGRGW